MKAVQAEAVRVAVIRAVPGKKIPYGNLTERYKVYLYNQIVVDLTFHGASHIDADQAARWARRAEPGEKKVIDPGIEITIEEVTYGVNV